MLLSALLWSVMKAALSLFIFSSLIQLGYAQTQVSGRVVDKQNEPVIGANIFIENTFDGTSSDLEGEFVFSTETTGAQTLVASFVGYSKFHQSIELTGKAIVIHVQLREAINKIDGVVITAGSFEAGGEHQREVLKDLDIVTTGGVSADIAGALNTLPGTQTVGEEGRLFVRGGDGYETKTYIDGLQVLRPYHTTVPNTPTRNRFSPFLFQGTSFSTGGYSAEYGQALSSALILNTKDKDMQNRADFSLLNLGLEAGYAFAGEETAIIAKVGYFNMSPYFNLVPQNIDWQRAPESLEVNLALRQKIGKQGQLKFYSNWNQGESDLLSHDIDEPNQTIDVSLDNKYHYFNTSYRNIVGQRWMVFTGFSFTKSKDTYVVAGQNIENSIQGSHTKLAFSGELNERVELNTGIDFYNRKYSNDIELPDQQINYKFTEPLLAVFAEADLYISNNLLARVGARIEKSWMNNEWSLSPRASLAYKIGEGSQFSFAYGKFHQAGEDELVRINSNLAYETSDHYILNYQYNGNQRTFRVEGYYKGYENLIKFDNSEPLNPAGYNNSGSGFATGFDLFWRDNKSIKNAEYWVSYSFLDTERDYKNYPYAAVPYFASAHNLSVVYKHFIPAIKSQVSGTYTFASGRPYNDPNMDVFNAGCTTSFQDIGVGVSFLAAQNLVLYFSVNNLLGRDNVFGYEYGNEQNELGEYNARPIKMPAKRFFIIGIFFTLSKEGTLNQMKSL